MYRKLLLLSLLCAPHTSGLSAVYGDHDKFAGIWFSETGTGGGFKGLNELDDGVLLSLVPLRIRYPDGTEEYRLKMQWEGPYLDFVNSRPKLILLIDGEKIPLEAAASVGHLIETPHLERGDLVERAEFPTTAEVITRLANAKRVEVAVYTSSGRLERSFSRGNKKIFREFVVEVMEKS